MSRLPPPISDYVTDTRSALDNSVRLAQVRRQQYEEGEMPLCRLRRLLAYCSCACSHFCQYIDNILLKKVVRHPTHLTASSCPALPF